MEKFLSQKQHISCLQYGDVLYFNLSFFNDTIKLLIFVFPIKKVQKSSV